MALKRFVIAALSIALAQSTMLVQQANAVPVAGASRLKMEVHSKTKPMKRPPALAGKRTVPPLAFISFCNRNAEQCAVHKGDLTMRNGLVIATPAVLAGLIRVNSQVNGSMRLHSDSPTQDVWKTDVSAGDCEDYVLTKRARLLAMGWPSSALSIAIVQTPKGEGHAVLIAHTDAGEFVLDNLKTNMLVRAKSDYRFISMQDGSRRLGWIKL
jgi:predicted transglutaminase-like cysteine proteinase